jgi:threonine dehydrogenase-like Zn-dependent dehydrogenase
MEKNNLAVSEKLTQKGFNQKKMKAAVITSPRKIEIKEMDIPEPLSDEIRIRMQGCGICGSDLPVWEGREWFNYPRNPGSPGHEGYGIVDEVGKDVKNFKPGERVAALSYNAYAEYDIVPESHVVSLPEFLFVVPFPGEPLGCAMNIFRRSDIGKDDVVAILGGGFIGNLLIQLSKHRGAEVIVISRRETSLQKSFESGADHLIKMDDHYRILEKVKEITNSKNCSRVIEATGKQWPLDIAGEIVSERGKMIIAGFHQDGPRQVNLQNWNWKGIDVINAHERNPLQYISGIKEAIDAVEKKILSPGMLYSHFFTMESLEKAFEVMSSREEGFLKAIIQY